MSSSATNGPLKSADPAAGTVTPRCTMQSENSVEHTTGSAESVWPYSSIELCGVNLECTK